MEIKNLLSQSRQIWWDQKQQLSKIIPCLWKVFWDICRWERNADKDSGIHTDQELKKEMWNVIFSTIKWCDDLWYDPEECINLAIECQRSFKK